MEFPATSATLLFRITRLVVLLALASAALVAFAVLRPLEAHMKAGVGGQEFAMLKAAAASLDSQLAAKQSLLRTAAARIAAEQDRASVLGKSLVEWGELKGEFADVMLLDGAGKVLARLDGSSSIGTVAAGVRDQLRALFRERKGMLAPLPFGAEARQAALLVMEPVRDAAGQVRYALAGSIAPDDARIGGQLAALSLGRSGYFFIVDASGTIVHHPDKRRLMTRALHDPRVASPTATAPAGFEGWREGRSERGEPALLAFKRLSGLPWTVAAVHPVEDAYAGVHAAKTGALVAAALVAIAAGSVGLAAAVRILRPLDELYCRVCDIEAGAADIAVLDVRRLDEVGALSQAFLSLSRQREAAEAKLARLAFTDALTGIANRRMLEDALACAIARSRRAGQVVAVAYLDIDRFKSINDTMGHQAGDAVLVEFAARLKTAVRAHDTVARLAGDEFMVVFDGISVVAEVEEAAKRILACIEVPFTHGGRSFPVTSSIGIALRPPHGSHGSAELIGRADAALYRAKKDGRNRYAVDAGPEIALSMRLMH